MLLGYHGNLADLRGIEREVLPLARLERPAVGQRLRLLLFGGSMAELAADVLGSVASIRGAISEVSMSAALRLVLRAALDVGSALNYGREVDVFGFTMDALPRLALFKATNDQRVTLLHLVAAQVPDCAEVFRDLDFLRRVRGLSISLLAESVGMFKHEAAHVSACASARSERSENLEDLMKRSAQESTTLEDGLSATRDDAKSLLAFFAVAARPAEVDTKAIELLVMLSEFVSVFERCAKELTLSAEMLATCQRGSLGNQPCKEPGNVAATVWAGKGCT